MLASDLPFYSFIQPCGSAFSFKSFCALIMDRALHFGEKSSSDPSRQGLKCYCYQKAGWMDE